MAALLWSRFSHIFRLSMTSIASINGLRFGLIERSFVNFDILSFRYVSHSLSNQPSQTHSAYKSDTKTREHVARMTQRISATITTSYVCFCLRCRGYCCQRLHCTLRILRCQRIFEIFILFNFVRIEMNKKKTPANRLDFEKKGRFLLTPPIQINN